jgi:hypothetical protein
VDVTASVDIFGAEESPSLPCEDWLLAARALCAAILFNFFKLDGSIFSLRSAVALNQRDVPFLPFL